MKKIITHLTGIVLLIAILIAGGCKQTATDENEGFAPQSKEVKIYMRAIKKAGKKHLKMYDTNDRGHKVVDMLKTEVQPGSIVIWERTWFSRIEEIKSISSKIDNGLIFTKDAQPIPGTKRFKLEVPQDVSSGYEEEYYIEFVDKKGKTWTIDPHLIIP